MPRHPLPPSVRLWPRVEKTGTCWLWVGQINHSGYGLINAGGRSGLKLLVHRVAYEASAGPIPPGLVIDHLCRVRNCVNPGHMEVVTNRENILRGVGFPAAYARQTHCVHGHEFTERNTHRTKLNERRCRACRRIWDAAYKARKKAER